MPKYNEEWLQNLIKDVEKEFGGHLAKSEAVMAKSEDGEEKSKDMSEKKHEDKKEDEKEPEAKDHEESHAEDEHEAKDHEEDGSAEDHLDYDDEDMEHMHKLYRSMSKSERKAHQDCLMKCIEEEHPHGAEGPVSEASKDQSMEKSDGCGGEMSSSDPKGSPGAKSEASKEQDKISKEMAKTETGKIESCSPGKTPGAKSEASKANGEKMEKSEKSELNLLKSENEQLKKNFDAVTEFLSKLVKKTAPQAKAITSLDVIAKSEVAEKTLSKSEIKEILLKKSCDSSLQKSDRDAINAYYLSGSNNINGISHLLK